MKPAPQAALRRRSAWLSTFIASLELARQGAVALAQAAALSSPIHVRATSGEQRETFRIGRAAGAKNQSMTKLQTPPPVGFTAGERNYIRGELDLFFSTLLTVAEGFLLKTWRGGSKAGQPKISPSAQALLDRGLMRLDTSQHLPRLVFTAAGLSELRRMMADRRYADPDKFAHVRRELRLDPMSGM